MACCQPRLSLSCIPASVFINLFVLHASGVGRHVFSLGWINMFELFNKDSHPP